MHALGMASQPPPAEPWLHVVLYQPEIPQNTGNIGRTCVALGAKLWIVRPTGFRLDDSQRKRAGLDYWEHLEWAVVDDWNDLCRQLTEQQGNGDRSQLEDQLPSPAVRLQSRMWLVTKFGALDYSHARYAPGDIIVLGRETNGLPESLRAAHPANRQIALPMPGPVRSLNLATCAGIVMYEAHRQISMTHALQSTRAEQA